MILLLQILISILIVIALVAIFFLVILPWYSEGALPTLEKTLQRLGRFRALISGTGSGPHPSLETTDIQELHVEHSGPPTPTPGEPAPPPMARLRNSRRGSDGDIVKAIERRRIGASMSKSMSEGLNREKEKDL
ncbi:unnamed protein product [Caenorhabditis brenneri]